MECIIRAEDAANALWIVVQGWVFKVRANHRDDQEFGTHIGGLTPLDAQQIPPNAVFGQEVVRFRPAPYGYAILSAAYSELYRLDREALETLLPYYPGLRARKAWAAIVLLIKRNGGAKRLKRIAAASAAAAGPRSPRSTGNGRRPMTPELAPIPSVDENSP